MTRPEKTIAKLQEGGPLTIAAIGDSLTQGWLVQKGYLSFLSEMLRDRYPRSECAILNRGIPGDTAEGGLLRIRDDVLDCDPDCVLIQFALNDAFMGVRVERYGNFVQAMIDAVKNETDAETVLVTSVYLDNNGEYEMALKYYGMLARLAESNTIPIARVHEYWHKKIQEGINFRSLVQYDLIHPRVEGYRLMAEAIMELF